ncbi:unnamed protein product [Trichogramma brassicae]|uniref:Uncharacterized protein n=1 Tax=Trichogramma brassicae TaxID=86971 RepID=A0A6H5IKU9_9HYME|nr:unnamed protein product [Trichogramma brassicae]
MLRRAISEVASESSECPQRPKKSGSPHDADPRCSTTRRPAPLCDLCCVYVELVCVAAGLLLLFTETVLIVELCCCEIVVMSESETIESQLRSLMSCLGSLATKSEAIIAAQVQNSAKIDSICTALTEQAGRLSALSSELADVKRRLTAASPGTEVRIKGVPLSVPHGTPELLHGIAREVFARIGSEQSIDDVQACRFLADDPWPQPRRSARSDNQRVIPTFSFGVTFKQPITRNHIVRLKRIDMAS